MSNPKDIHVLIPTFERLKALAVTLTSLSQQSEKSFKVLISDQSFDERIYHDKTIQAVIHVLELHGNPVTVLKNFPQKGMAQQRQFLLEHSDAPYSLFLDDDIILESYVLSLMKQTLQKYNCGFVGSALIGLGYKNDVRPQQQKIEFWDNTIEPESITPDHESWQRYKLHNAANVLHVQEKFDCTADHPKVYKIAWVGGCVMYDTQKLSDSGAFQFWKDLPPEHCGEDVLAQLRVMKKYGGCGILPSGAYHQEVATSIPLRKINAPEFLKI